MTAWQTWFERERVEHAILALTAKPELPGAILTMVEDIARQGAVTTCDSYEEIWRSLVTEATHRLMKGGTPESVVEWLGREAARP